MQASPFSRFMHARKYVWELRIFKPTTSNAVSVSGCEKPSRRAVHTSPTATTTSSDCFLPFWVPGSGHYGQTLGRNNKEVIENASDFILAHIDTVPVMDDGVFTVADYGTNDGFTSMNLMGRIIGQLRKKHGEKLPIQIMYEDQEKNDFNSLFNRLSDGTGYLSEYSNVYPFATNVHFYKQCVPDGTCDVIFTNMAIHFLDNPNVNFKDGFFHATANADSEELRRFHAEAERDWIKFLLLRARELKKGGLLFALTAGTSEDFQYGTQEDSTKTGEGDQGKTAESLISTQGSSSLDVLMDLECVWKQFKQENIIAQEEYEKCFLPCIFRTVKEDTAPFKAADSPVVEAGLTMVYHDQVFHDSVFKQLWREKQRIDGLDNRAYFAELLSKSFMVAVNTSFSSSLSDSRNSEDKEAILNEPYKRFEARVAIRDPETYRADYIVNRVIARKV